MERDMKITRTIAFVTLAMLTTGLDGARAATYDWTISGSGYTGSGSLTTGLAGYNNSWPCATCVAVGDAIASFSGKLNGNAVSLLATQDTPTYPGPGFTINSSVGFHGNDNLIYPNSPFLDWGDIGFLADSVDYNVFNGNYTGHPGDWLPASNNQPFGIYSNPVTFTLTAVPEPATWAMMLFGLFGLGAVRSARRRHLAASVSSSTS
jgi:PEP-CTERM motif